MLLYDAFDLPLHAFLPSQLHSILLFEKVSKSQNALAMPSSLRPHTAAPLINGRMLEQKADTLAVVRAPARLGQRGRDVDGLDAVAQGLLGLVRHRVGHDNVLELAVVQRLDGIAAEDAVGDDGQRILRAVLDDDVGGLAQRAARVGHVVDDDGGFTRHVADQNHARDLVGAGALLVDQGEAKVEAVGNGGGSVWRLDVALFKSE